ncbi:MAG: hypothetical protein PVJ68_08905 [Candidatus Thiodiazotropha sp.]
MSKIVSGYNGHVADGCRPCPVSEHSVSPATGCFNGTALNREVTTIVIE